MSKDKDVDIDNIIALEYPEDMNLPKLRSYSRNSKTKAIVFRADSVERKILQQKADKYTGGNYSEFLRHAIMRWEPTLTEEEKLYAEQDSEVS